MSCERASLLTTSVLTEQDQRITKLLAFFGVPWVRLTTDEFLNGTLAETAPCAKVRLFSSAEAFLQLLEIIESSRDSKSLWTEHFHSIFLYGAGNSAALQRLAAKLSGTQESLRKTRASDGCLIVSDQWDDFCGVMSGLRVPCKESAPRLVLRNWHPPTTNLVYDADGAVFVRIEHNGVSLFLSTSDNLVDLDSPVGASRFDVCDHFVSAVPVVLYIRWAFGEACWNAPEVSACVIVDDPVLKPRYGFIEFEKLLGLMVNEAFSTNVAFIPWNWRKTQPEVARLFREHPDRFSLSVHGCDHTSGEFGSRDLEALSCMVKKAIGRMERHEAETGIYYDRVMVFPQGVFSGESLEVLKQNNFLAAVNTDMLASGSKHGHLTCATLWDTASMTHHDFPLFSRRYPSEGIENFAFDILLGKPCIVVTHHDDYRDGYAHLTEFIRRLNNLKCQLSWRGLGDLVRRSYRQRQTAAGEIEVEIYGSQATLENHSTNSTRIILKKREGNSSAVERILAGSQQLNWTFSDRYITSEIELQPGQSTCISVVFQDLSRKAPCLQSTSRKLRTAFRRSLCELRDDYFHPLKNFVRHGG